MSSPRESTTRTASYHRTTMSHHVFTISHIPVSTSPMMLTYMGIIQHEYGYKEWDESDEIKIRCWHMQWHSSSIAYQSVTRHRHTDTQYSILINSIFQTLFGGESLNCISSSSSSSSGHLLYATQSTRFSAYNANPYANFVCRYSLMTA